MIIAKYFVEFVIYSFLGWIYECTYCSIKSKHWSNRGFLYGPVCPIYGVGAISCSIIFGNFNLTLEGETPIWEIFVICAFGSAILEYATSYILEKRFNAMWWDYSNTPFNINGRICLPATMGFGIAGIIVVKFILPVAESVKGQMQPVFAEILALFFMGVLAADTALTVQSLIDLTQKLDNFEVGFNNKIEENIKAIHEMPGEIREKYASFTSKLTERQKYALYSIKKYTSQSRSFSAASIKNYLESIGSKIKKNLPERHEKQSEDSE
ncbi:MAG: putative ABC transporter permease [Butyrivibrio sp.]|uniref:putative ABC transporter permease n=1 Tax=Butyrivibrio sp. TaxID=28121 RepID=UPI0025CF25A3|nr:putative ABC transporter permease [Butyrivibrio sp.]MCR5771322.1 putative ABC transporter permease [Butyrivibrio sp.]